MKNFKKVAAAALVAAVAMGPLTACEHFKHKEDSKSERNACKGKHACKSGKNGCKG